MQYGNFPNDNVPWLATPWPPPPSAGAMKTSSRRSTHSPPPLQLPEPIPRPSMCTPAHHHPLSIPSQSPLPWMLHSRPQGFPPMQFGMPLMQQPPLWSSFPSPPHPPSYFLSSPTSSCSSGLHLPLPLALTSSVGPGAAPLANRPIIHLPPYSQGLPTGSYASDRQAPLQCTASFNTAAAVSSDRRGRPTDDICANAKGGACSDGHHTGTEHHALGFQSWQAALAPVPAHAAPVPAPQQPMLSEILGSSAAHMRKRLGPNSFATIRLVMLRQQATFTQQLFEMHKLAQVQGLLLCEMGFPGAPNWPAEATQSPSVPGQSQCAPAQSPSVPAQSPSAPAQSQCVPAQSQSVPAQSQSVPAQSPFVPAQSQSVPAQMTPPAASSSGAKKPLMAQVQPVEIILVSLSAAKCSSAAAMATSSGTSPAESQQAMRPHKVASAPRRDAAQEPCPKRQRKAALKHQQLQLQHSLVSGCSSGLPVSENEDVTTLSKASADVSPRRLPGSVQGHNDLHMSPSKASVAGTASLGLQQVHPLGKEKQLSQGVLRPLARHPLQPPDKTTAAARAPATGWTSSPIKAGMCLQQQLSEAGEATPSSSEGMAAASGCQSEASVGLAPSGINCDYLCAAPWADASLRVPPAQEGAMLKFGGGMPQLELDVHVCAPCASSLLSEERKVTAAAAAMWACGAVAVGSEIQQRPASVPWWQDITNVTFESSTEATALHLPPGCGAVQPAAAAAGAVLHPARGNLPLKKRAKYWPPAGHAGDHQVER